MTAATAAGSHRAAGAGPLPTPAPAATLPLYVRHRRLLLVLITLMAAILRFAALDRPVLWGDEALTYSRVIGTYGQMLEILRDDGFMPLHYTLYWWLAQGMPIGFLHLAPNLELTPPVMRFIPALCGTLMVPAMYFAARQLAPVRVALLAAAFAAVSAYLMGYSHDAKMYMQAWLCVALHLACAWWWLRAGGSIAWLAWTASGLAAVSFHPAAALLLLIQPIYLLTQRKAHWRQGVLMAAGLAVIALGPAGYYMGFNRWTDNTGGLVRTDPAADGRWSDSGIQWVEAFNRGSSGWTLMRESAGSYLIGFAWTGAERRHRQQIDPLIRAGAITAFTSLLGLMLLGAMPWRRRIDPSTPPGDDTPEPWWRSLLWLSVATIVPIYGFYYCRSIDNFASPLDAWRWAWSLLGTWGWLAALLATIALAAACQRSGDLLRLLALPGAAIAAALLVLAGLAAMDTDPTPPERTAILTAMRWLGVGGMIVLIAALWHRGGSTLRQRLTSTGLLALVAVIIIGLCAAAHAFWQRQYQLHWEGLQAIHGPAATPATRPDLDWMSLWIPRYAGIVWAPLAIAACMLLLRLPTRPLRAVAVVLLLGVNLAGALARLVVGTEAPLDRVFDDVKAVRDSGGDTRIMLASLDDRRWGVDRWLGSSAYGLYGSAGKYYACIHLGLDVSPAAFRNGSMTALYRPWLGDVLAPEQIPRALAQRGSPAPTRLVIWERYIDKFARPEDLPANDRILQALGDDWQLAQPPEIFWLRGYLDWTEMGWTRRREFIRRDAH